VYKRRHRVADYGKPFTDCESSNDTWSADYKGQFRTKDGRYCYPLTVSDNYSRYLLGCLGMQGTSYSDARPFFEHIFREYGLPIAIKTDNGAPFASISIGGLSRLSIWWIKLGIIPERIEKGCPQQNSRHERIHRTLKLEAINPASVDMKRQQIKFDAFRNDYNNYRPHEALGQKPPASVYVKSSRPYNDNPVVDYDLGFVVRKVRSSGEFKFRGNLYFLTELLYGETIALKEIDNDTGEIDYSFYKIGELNLRKNRIIKQ
jgi:transposase InsO family protein